MSFKRIAAPIMLIIFWHVLSTLDIIPSYKLPSPLRVLSSLDDLILIGMPPGQKLYLHVYYSLQRVFSGFLAAFFLAVPLGILTGRFSSLRSIIEPIIELIRPIPPLAWIPIAILWFGIGNGSAAFIIFLGVFFPILLTTINGVRTIDPILIDAARTLNATNRQILFKVVLPGAVPGIFTGLRVGMGIGWMTLVAAEFTGVKQGYGLGQMIMTARDLQRPDAVIAGMLVIGLIGSIIDRIFYLIRKRMITWHSA
jgi:ABC-type nitrate/sulfonate/bicarbonate transport system permease component